VNELYLVIHVLLHYIVSIIKWNVESKLIIVLFLFIISGSPEPRSPRSPAIKFRVGQVVRHKRWGYRGVIIGWDTMARVSTITMHYQLMEIQLISISSRLDR